MIRKTTVAATLLAITCWQANSLVIAREKPKPEQWGKEVNGIAVSITPKADEPGKVVIQWKNSGKETLELPWVRLNSDVAYKHLDDLLNQVSLKKADGSLVPTRIYKFPIIGGPPYRPRTVILEPGKMHQETIDLWTYLEKPADPVAGEFWIELNIESAFAPSQKGVRYWTGMIKSNVVELKMAK
jgi:hypothetical protein